MFSPPIQRFRLRSLKHGFGLLDNLRSRDLIAVRMEKEILNHRGYAQRRGSDQIARAGRAVLLSLLGLLRENAGRGRLAGPHGGVDQRRVAAG